MRRIIFTVIFPLLSVVFVGQSSAQNIQNSCNAAPSLGGVYRIDVDRSDKLYSVIEGATSKVPYSEQQQFFMDLAVRLTPPDLLAIDCRGNRVSLASSRAARIEFVADGKTRTVRNSGGGVVRSRIGFERGNLVFNSSGGSNDQLNFVFTVLDNGQALRVSRRISAEELIDPVVIQTVYVKINEIARWDIFGNSQLAQNEREIDRVKTPTVPRRLPNNTRNDEVDELRAALDQWIAATNARDIEQQMAFYMPQLKAFYLTRNASVSSVRQEKNRTFAKAKSIDISAAEPEIIFQDGGQTAIMRFRKKYNIVNVAKSRSGEVVQELRWQQNNGRWKIFSERDIKVIR